MNLQNLVYCGLQGVANRGCSIRVGRETEKKGKGMGIFACTYKHCCSYYYPTSSTYCCLCFQCQNYDNENDFNDNCFSTGYLEDRRPASNMDPYVVTSLLAETTLLWEPTLEAEALAAQKLALQV